MISQAIEDESNQQWVKYDTLGFNNLLCIYNVMIQTFKKKGYLDLLMIEIMAHCQHGRHESNMVLKDTHGFLNSIQFMSLPYIPYPHWFNEFATNLSTYKHFQMFLHKQ
jgi:hypothetical protein